MQRTLFLRQNTISAYALEEDILSEGQRKYNWAMSDDTGSEWGIQIFCSQTGCHESLSINNLETKSIGAAPPNTWWAVGAPECQRGSEGHGWERGEPRKSLCFTQVSSQNKSICTWTAEEWWRPRLQQVPHSKGLWNDDDQCCCHWSSHPGHTRRRSIHHCLGRARTEVPWICTYLKRQFPSALLKSRQNLLIMIMILPMT